MNEELLINLRNGVLYLTINRPERRNAINAAVLDGLVAGIDRADRDADIHAVVITGAGNKAFCGSVALTAR